MADVPRRALCCVTLLLLVGCRARGSESAGSGPTSSTAATSSMPLLSATASASPAPATTLTASPAANASPTTFAANELASLAELPIRAAAPMTGYSRAQFGPAWPELAGCDARNSVLARDLTKSTLQGNCVVKSGILVSPYSGVTINFGSNPALRTSRSRGRAR